MVLTPHTSVAHPGGRHRARHEDPPTGHKWQLLTRKVHEYVVDPRSPDYNAVRTQRDLLDGTGAQPVDPQEVLSPRMAQLLRHLSPLPVQSARVGWTRDPERPQDPPTMILEARFRDTVNFPLSRSEVYISSRTAQPEGLKTLGPADIDPFIYEEATLGPNGYPSVMIYELRPPNIQP